MTVYIKRVWHRPLTLYVLVLLQDVALAEIDRPTEVVEEKKATGGILGLFF